MFSKTLIAAAVAATAAVSGSAYAASYTITEDTVAGSGDLTDTMIRPGDTVAGQGSERFDVMFNANQEGEGSWVIAASDANETKISNLGDLNINGKAGMAVYTYGQLNLASVPKLTITDVNNLNIGTTDARFDGSPAIHAMGGTIGINVNDSVKVYTGLSSGGGNAVMVQQTGNLSNAHLNITAKNDIILDAQGNALLGSIAGNSNSESNEEGSWTTLTAGRSIQIVSQNGAAVSASDKTTWDNGQQSAEGYGTVDIQLNAPTVSLVGKTYGILNNQQSSQTNDQTGLAVSVTGNRIDVAGGTSAVRVSSNDETENTASLDLTANEITLTGENAAEVAGNGELTMGAGEDAEEKGSIIADGSIAAEEGTVTIDNSDVRVTAGHEARIGTFNATEGTVFTFESSPVLKIGRNNSTDTQVVVEKDGVDGYASGEEAAAQWKNDVDFGTDAQGNKASGSISGYGTTANVYVDGSGNVTVEGSDITKSTNDLAALNLVSWRNETTNINDRMSTLRSNPRTVGVWARYNGGEYQYDARNIKNQFNTVEVGVDAQVAPQWVVGASFSYTSGDGDMDYGETDTDTYAGALYALWTHEKGSFIDFVMKAGRMSSDFDFRNLQGGAFDKGTFDQTGFIVGIETGHRFSLPMNTFIEPQIQVTYSRLSSVSETTAQRRVNLEASDSLLGRVGFMAGISCPNDRGAAYVKASFVRDFRGDIDGTYSTREGTAVYKLSQDLDDNWFEYAIGANFKVSDNFVTFVEASKSAGADIDLDWRANIGAKIFF